MSPLDFGQFVLTIAALLAAVHGLGYLSERLKQPRIVGEILAGIILGPFALKLLAPAVFAKLFTFSPSANVVLGFLYQLGLILLMFCSGAETRRLLAKENRKKTILLIILSDVTSFVFVLGLGYLGFIPLARLTGSASQETATLLILAIATSVTSIPVISRIFWDLGIMRTRFVSLLLGYAVLEDVALWTVLAFATALANSTASAKQHVANTVFSHVFSTFIFMLVAMVIMPYLLRWISNSRWNILHRASPVGYVIFVLMTYCAVAALLDVNLQFAALLAGYGIVGGIQGTERERFAVPLESIAKVSFGVFVPIYFGIVGLSPGIRTRILHGSAAHLLLRLVCDLDIFQCAGGQGWRFSRTRCHEHRLTTNARGGPGIVLASVAYDSGIINAAFYTALVITAVVTSQACGAWLRYILSKGLPLLSSNPEETWQTEPAKEEVYLSTEPAA